jgi:methyl-accepting chemotaxis protein
MADTQKERLDRIEFKLDQMAEVMVSLARVEEKLQASEDVRTNALTRMNRFSEKLDEIEKVCDSNHTTIKVINKIVWLISAAIIAGTINVIWM